MLIVLIGLLLVAGLAFEALAILRGSRPTPRIQRRLMMEWRVFLPQLEEETDGWIPSALRRQYEERVQLLLQSFPMCSQETRVDRYLVGYQHFGIKYRGRDKLEMKIRSKRSKSLPGAEIWDKKKLGTDTLETYLPKIEKHVGPFCASCVVDDPQLVDVDKIRCKSTVGIVDREICQIMKNPAYTNRAWLSVALEGSEEEIGRILKSSPEYQALYNVLDVILLIVQTERVNSLRAKFFPVLSGYPAWLNILRSDTPEQSSGIIFDDCSNLLSFSSHARSIP